MVKAKRCSSDGLPSRLRQAQQTAAASGAVELAPELAEPPAREVTLSQRCQPRHLSKAHTQIRDKAANNALPPAPYDWAADKALIEELQYMANPAPAVPGIVLKKPQTLADMHGS